MLNKKGESIMNKNKFRILIGVFSILLFIISCMEADKDVSAFKYDETAITNAKPWTSKNFKNNPDNFQFVIIGDRTGGANPQHTLYWL